MIKARILAAEIDDKNRLILTEDNIPDDKEVWGIIDYRTAMLMSVCDEMSYCIEKANRPLQANAVLIHID